MATSPSSPNAEVLVHIIAPSRASDDVSYRQLAQAYLDFQPESSTRIPLQETSQVAGAARPEHKQVPLQSATSPSGEFTTRSVDQSFEINSVDLSFQSVLDNRASPRLRYSPGQDVIASSSPQEANVLGSQTSWCAPPSQISDSYPMPNQALLQISPTRVLERYIGHPNSCWVSPASPSPSRLPQQRPIQSLHPGSVDISSSLPKSEPEEQESLEIQLPGYIKLGKTIPVTPQVPKTVNIPQSSVCSSGMVVDESLLDITHISSSVPSDTPNRAGSEPAPTKRPKIAHLKHRDLVRSSSDSGPIPSSNIASSINSVAFELGNSLEIRPPSPPVGISDVDPADFISAKMAKLASHLPSHYRPDAKREIDPFERGYWLLDCSAWAPEDRFNAWVFLNNYLRHGHAGWGTWCRRDSSHDWVRLYCWGYVAKHMYLVLYVASKRMVKNTGAKWYGADGELVLNITPS